MASSAKEEKLLSLRPLFPSEFNKMLALCLENYVILYWPLAEHDNFEGRHGQMVSNCREIVRIWDGFKFALDRHPRMEYFEDEANFRRMDLEKEVTFIRFFLEHRATAHQRCTIDDFQCLLRTFAALVRLICPERAPLGGE